ncbi:MAG: hypothetical protein ABSC34_03765 [Acidimicrobiales bacterium]|jgi:hypothetical protein
MRQRWRAFWTPLRVVDLVVVVSVIYVTIWALHPALLVSSSTITGGDTGSHFAVPAFLHSQGNIFNLTPWYPGWLDGLPAYTYYWILPDYLASLGGYVINFMVAFKLATVLGSVLMPITAYCMGRLFKAPRPIPAALAVATLPFLFDASFTIDGGNLFSTMAGEYAFSLSLALSLLCIGLFARGVRTGRGYWWAALALSATLAAHVLPWFFALGAIFVLVVYELLQRRGIGDPNDLDMARGDYARPLRFAAGAGLLSLGLSAWWLLPFGTSQSFSNSLGYVNQPVNTVYQVFAQLGWDFRSPTTGTITAGGDRWVIVLAAIALVVAFIVRDRLGMVLATLTVGTLAAYVLDPQSVIFNERLVPFWFISIHLSAGWLFGYGLARLLRWWQRRTDPSRFDDGVFDGAVDSRDDGGELEEPHDVGPESVPAPVLAPAGPYDETASEPLDEGRHVRRTVIATVVVALLGLASTVPSLIPQVASALHLNTTGNQVSVWAQTNYSGYQAQSGWPEFEDIIATMKSVAKHYGCGRAMWEYNSDQQRFGTPEALMTLPYWTNNCVDSMEGLYFESSPTTPYHFLDQSELSAQPSDAQAGLPYGFVNVKEGVEHLQMLGVKYFLAFSPVVVAQANADPQLTLVATTKAWPAPGDTWRFYVIKNSPMVQGMKDLPNVVANVASRVDWLNANVTWWLNPHLWSTFVAESGPSNWPRTSSVDSMTDVALPALKVSDVVVHSQAISFHVSRVGVPVVVKISYYPRWHAVGATGPYRVSPNLMAVVPTSKDVSLVYGSTAANVWGDRVSQLTALAGLVTIAAFVRRRRRRTAREALQSPPASADVRLGALEKGPTGDAR